MIRGLAEKELRQHTTLLVVLMLLLAGGLVMLHRNEVLARFAGSTFASVQILLRLFLPVSCLVLGNTLIAGEFRNHTQLFLEGLPMPRWMMLAVKYALGLATAVASAMLMVATAWWFAHGGEVMTPRFTALLLVKAAGWAWFCWAVCFGHAFLGRYRLVTGIVIVGGLIWAESSLGLQVDRFGPFDLIGSRFAYERFVWPVVSLWTTAAVIVSVTALGFALGLVRDATVAALLSEKMSSREKTALTVIAIVALVMVGTVVQQRRDTSPLHLPGSADVALRAATVSVAAAVKDPTEKEKAALAAHAQAAAGLLAGAGDYLGCQHLPPLFLVHRRDMQRGEFEDGDLDSRQGCLVRLNLVETPPDDVALQARLLKQVLGANQHERLNSDERGWVLDGFSQWWPLRDKAGTAAAFMDQCGERSLLEKTSLTGDDLRRWLEFTERADDEKSTAACAGVGVIVLGKAGAEQRRQFLGGVLGYSAPHDFRASVHDALNPVSTLLQAATGMDLDALARQWNAALHARQEAAP